MLRLNLYDVVYWTGLLIAAPIWLARQKSRRKVLGALRHRMGRIPDRKSGEQAILIHAVSLGEMNATRALIVQLAQARPDVHFIVTTTTETGLARGQQLYEEDERVTLARFPLDLTSALSRMLGAVKPDLIVLMELEVWPNLMHYCASHQIPVLLINGRMTESSYRGYRLAGPITKRMFRRLTLACVQDDIYANRFAALGVPREKLRVIGTMKFDNAQIQTRVAGAAELARDVGLQPGAMPIWVCGSTGPGEEAIILDVFRRLAEKRPLRLVIVPRHPERFDEVATLILDSGLGLVRRSGKPTPLNKSKSLPVILGDTMGELRKFYGLADVVLVGRTLVDLGPRQHGSDMIEPAALAKPVVVGPFTHNFAEPMRCFLNAGAIRQIASPDFLEQTVSSVLDSPGDTGVRGQEVVRQQQGATARHAQFILDHLKRRTHQPAEFAEGATR